MQARPQALQRRQGGRRVDQLVGAAQRRVGQAVAGDRLARTFLRLGHEPELPLLLVAGIAEIAPQQQQIGAALGRHLGHARGRPRIGADGRPASAEYMRLFPADALAVVAQVGLVVQVDAGQDRAIGVDQVDRIEPAAQADLEDRAVQFRLHEQQQHRQGGKLEIGQLDRAAGGARGKARRLDPRERGRELGVAGFDPGDARALVETDQVRRGVEPGAKARGAQDRLQHGAGRTLAVGAAHHHHRAGEADAEARLHLADPREAKRDVLRMQALDVGQPGGQGGVGCGAQGAAGRCEAPAAAMLLMETARLRASGKRPPASPATAQASG